jgi:hypothetical protein
MMKKLLLGAALAGLLAVGQAQANVGPPNVLNYAAPNPSGGTTATTAVMMGLGYAGEFTPHFNGVVEMTISGTIANGTASSGGSVQIVYGTGSAPANAATYTGLACGAPVAVTNNASTAAVGFPFSIDCVATGMALNVPYWIDAALARTTGTSGTVTISNLTITASEQ